MDGTTLFHGYRFGRFTLDLDRQQLLLGDRSIPLARKNFEVLQVLVEARGRIVPRDELACAVWPDTVLEESTLRQNIYSLRTLLRELDQESEYLETVPKVGYRLAVSVEQCEEPVPPGSRHIQPSVDQGRRWLWAAIGVLAVVAIAGWAVALRRDGRDPTGHGASVSELVSRGWNILDRRDGALFPAAQSMFDEALRWDPRSAAAHSGRAVLFALTSDEVHALAEARRVSELQPGSGTPFAVRGFVQMMNHWEWNEAGDLMKQLDQRDCPDIFCAQWRSLYLALTGQLQLAIRTLGSSVQANPSRLAARAQLGQILYWAGETGPAIRELQAVADAYGGSTHARLHLWKAQLAAGDTAGAYKNVLLAREPSSYSLPRVDQVVRLEERAGGIGRVEFFTQLGQIEEQVSSNTYFMAELAMAAGDTERALTQLERSLASHNFFLPFAKRDPLFAPLRGNPRYEAVMKKVGL